MYQKVLVPLDGSKLAECVLPHITGIIKDCNATEVVLAQVVEPVTIIEGDWFEGGVAESNIPKLKSPEEINKMNMFNAKDYLQKVATELGYGGKVNTEVITGKAAESIAEYAEKNNIDLIIIATHGRSGPSRWIFGSVADRILRSACIPVLMVRGPGCVLGI